MKTNTVFSSPYKVFSSPYKVFSSPYAVFSSPYWIPSFSRAFSSSARSMLSFKNMLFRKPPASASLPALPSRTVANDEACHAPQGRRRGRQGERERGMKGGHERGRKAGGGRMKGRADGTYSLRVEVCNLPANAFGHNSFLDTRKNAI